MKKLLAFVSSVLATASSVHAPASVSLPQPNYVITGTNTCNHTEGFASPITSVVCHQLLAPEVGSIQNLTILLDNVADSAEGLYRFHCTYNGSVLTREPAAGTGALIFSGSVGAGYADTHPLDSTDFTSYYRPVASTNGLITRALGVRLDFATASLGHRIGVLDPTLQCSVRFTDAKSGAVYGVDVTVNYLAPELALSATQPPVVAHGKPNEPMRFPFLITATPINPYSPSLTSNESHQLDLVWDIGAPCSDWSPLLEIDGQLLAPAGTSVAVTVPSSGLEAVGELTPNTLGGFNCPATLQFTQQ